MCCKDLESPSVTRSYETAVHTDCSIFLKAGFSTRLNGSISLASKRTTFSVSWDHFALSCLYFVCQLLLCSVVQMKLSELFSPALKTATGGYVSGALSCWWYCWIYMAPFYYKSDMSARLDSVAHPHHLAGSQYPHTAYKT